MDRTEQSRPCTAVPQLTELAPRPAKPTQRLTARPLPHDLDPYKAPEATKPATATTATRPAPSARPGALISRNLFDDELRPASWDAFGTGGAA